MSVKNHPVIGIFDSGLGGISVLAEVQKALPHGRFVYALDDAHFPYGTRKSDEVVRLTLAAAKRLVQQHACDIVIIACNTASTAALAVLRQNLTIPIIGTVPAIKPAAALTKTGLIGLLATPATVTRAYTDDLIARFAHPCRVVRHGSAKLVDLAEAKLRGQIFGGELLAAVAAEILPLFALGDGAPQARMDQVVLGCTHFPLLLPEINAAAPWPVNYVDSARAIAERTRVVLSQLDNDQGGAQTKRVEAQAPSGLSLKVVHTGDAGKRLELAQVFCAWGSDSIAGL